MRRLSDEGFSRAIHYIKSEARPLERALFAYEFEGAERDDVLHELHAYQWTLLIVISSVFCVE